MPILCSNLSEHHCCNVSANKTHEQREVSLSASKTWAAADEAVPSSPEQRLLSPHRDDHEWIRGLWADSQSLKPVKSLSLTANFSIFLPSIHPSANPCRSPSAVLSPSSLLLLRPLLLSSHPSVTRPPPCSHRSLFSPLFHPPSLHLPFLFFPFLPPSLQCQSVLSMWAGAEASLCAPPLLLLSYLFHSWQAWEGSRPPLANERVNFHMHYSHTEPPQDSTQPETPCSALQHAAAACQRSYGCIQMYRRVQKTFAHYRDACDVQRCFTEGTSVSHGEEKTPPALRNKSDIYRRTRLLRTEGRFKPSSHTFCYLTPEEKKNNINP